jgi:hypothetical protein
MATQEQKTIWLIGAVEKLGNLGFMNSLSHRLDEYGISIFWEVDEIRDILFEDNNELKMYIYGWFHEDLDDEDLDDLYDIVLTFKNNRNKVFTYGMNNFLLVK